MRNSLTTIVIMGGNHKKGIEGYLKKSCSQSEEQQLQNFIDQGSGAID